MWDEQVSSFRKEKVMQSKEIKNIAPFAVQASWNLGKWDHYTKYLKVLNSQDHAYEKNFYQAILDIKNKRYDDADKHIEKARDILDPKLTSLLGESYDRAYSCI
jgi:FKBP12-rapamycin complex-associated protein